jgi:hypothetical protein
VVLSLTKFPPHLDLDKDLGDLMLMQTWASRTWDLTENRYVWEFGGLRQGARYHEDDETPTLYVLTKEEEW